jgi:hypothetical protein
VGLRSEVCYFIGRSGATIAWLWCLIKHADDRWLWRGSNSVSGTLLEKKLRHLMQMPQLVRVSHHIDRRHLAVLDLQRGRLQFAVGFQGDEAGEAVDEAGADEFRAVVGEMIGEIAVEFHDLVDAEKRALRGRTLAAAVRVGADVGRQHRGQCALT